MIAFLFSSLVGLPAPALTAVSRAVSFLLAQPSGQTTFQSDLSALPLPNPATLSSPQALIEMETRVAYDDLYRKGELRGRDASYGQHLNTWFRYSRQAGKGLLSISTQMNKQTLDLTSNSERLTQFYRLQDLQTLIAGELAWRNRYLLLYAGASGVRHDLPLRHGGIAAQRSGTRSGVDYSETSSTLSLESKRADLELALDLHTRRAVWSGWFEQQVGQLVVKGLGSFIQWQKESYWGITPHFSPAGRETRYHAVLEGHAGTRIMALGGRGGSLDISSYGARGDLTFAKLTVMRGTYDGLFLSLKNQRGRGFGISGAILEAEMIRFTGNGRGHVEFWPWTSGWMDLLGERRYGVYEADATLLKYHYGRRFPLSPKFRIEGNIFLFDLYPESELTHWRPVALGIGVDDLTLVNLTVERLLAGALSIQLIYSRGRFEMSWEGTQLFPIRVWERGSEGPSTGPIEVDRIKRPREYGGGFHRITLAYRTGRL